MKKKILVLGIVLVLFALVAGIAFADWDRCDRCAGSGTLNCSTCNGRGTVGIYECGSCDGRGYVTCPGCDGKGQRWY